LSWFCPLCWQQQQKNGNRNDLRWSHHGAGRRRGFAFSFVDGVFLHLCVPCSNEKEEGKEVSSRRRGKRRNRKKKKEVERPHRRRIPVTQCSLHNHPNGSLSLPFPIAWDLFQQGVSLSFNVTLVFP
jgi:hypothetical protein